MFKIHFVVITKRKEGPSIKKKSDFEDSPEGLSSGGFVSHARATRSPGVFKSLRAEL